jgi:hypothetical protein
MWLRLPAATAGILVQLSATPLVRAGSPERLKWDQLSTIVGKTVSVAMPDSAVISGTATALEADALVVRVAKTTNAKTCAKGSACRVPRATLRVMEMRAKTSRYPSSGPRPALWPVWPWAGWRDSPSVGGGHNARAAAAGAGIVGAFVASGYLIGNAADQRFTTIEIIPD